jgi:hypothetical protein
MGRERSRQNRIFAASDETEPAFGIMVSPVSYIMGLKLKNIPSFECLNAIRLICFHNKHTHGLSWISMIASVSLSGRHIFIIVSPA